jgi:hypothetical protein
MDGTDKHNVLAHIEEQPHDSLWPRRIDAGANE